MLSQSNEVRKIGYGICVSFLRLSDFFSLIFRFFEKKIISKMRKKSEEKHDNSCLARNRFISAVIFAAIVFGVDALEFSP